METNKNIKEDFPEIVESFNSSLNDIFKGKINELSVKNVLDLLKDKDISIITDLITDTKFYIKILMSHCMVLIHVLRTQNFLSLV